MDETSRLIIVSFGLGLVLCAAPGPVFAETVRRGVSSGFRPALAVQIGSIVGDAVWAVLGLAGVGVLVQAQALRVPIGVAGVIYLMWLAWDAWRASRHEFAGTTIAGDRSHTALRSGILLSLTNPQNLAYWAALGSALSGLGLHEPTASDYAAFYIGFMLASLVWAPLFAALVDRLLGRASTRWARVTYRICAVAFLLLALASLRQLWTSFQQPSSYCAPHAVSGESRE